MRVVGIDAGTRRIGLAMSDATAVLASPWKAVSATGDPRMDAERLAETIQLELARLDESLQAIVVGHPRRLDGSPTQITGHVEALAGALRELVQVPVVLQDERLTSLEAEARLAEREKDWRTRKQKLDAAAAAVMLQDYLDTLTR